MKSFLRQVAELFWQQKGAEVSRMAFVFPNRRAGLFFQKYLSEVADKPLFSPTILTISDLFVQLSGLKQTDHISLLFRLYNIYISQSGRSETFDQFFYWGEMLLNDFNDVDKYLVDAKALFSNIGDLKDIEEAFGDLDPQIVETLQSFWLSFRPKEKDVNQKAFLSMWQLLYGIYTELKRQLIDEKQGYEGMIFREVTERMMREQNCYIPYERIVFVGLNAMSHSEEKLLDLLQEQDRADFYWDYDSPYVIDPENKASFFALRNLKRYPSAYDLPKEERSSAPAIEVTGIPGAIGQAKQMSALLNTLCGDGSLDDEKALRTAVVLPDERMLVPVLNSIPEKIRHINVTMGYPLKETPIAVLIDLIIDLQRNVCWEDGKCCFYYRDVMAVMNHRYVFSSSSDLMDGIIEEILKGNIIHVPADMLTCTPLLSIIFRYVESTTDLSAYLIEVIEALNAQLPETTDDEEELSAATRLQRDTEKEFLFKYYTIVNRMREAVRQTHVDMSLTTYYRLLKKTVDSVTIPFVGEPLSGLQIMGVLETRALDFDRVIILSMNEGIFPLKKAAGSFIPYNLRKGFGLPTYEHQDSVWAYHFYRLIYRAEEVHLLYDTRTEGLLTGEVSRYVAQMHYLYHIDIRRHTVAYQIKSSGLLPITVNKTPAVMEMMSRFSEGKQTSQRISASTINQYIDCPLKFFFANVEGIQEEDEVEETIQSSLFGSLFHKVMQILYTPYIGKTVTREALDAMQKNDQMLSGAICQAFAENFFKDGKTHDIVGYNHLVSYLIREYVQKVLEKDGRIAPFEYIGSEKLMSEPFPLSDGRIVYLKGFIDRVDRVNGVLRIIDYKSGSVTLKSGSVEDLFEINTKDRASQVLQVFLYSWLYRRDAGRDIQIFPAVYSLKDLYSVSFDPHLKIAKQAIDDFAVYEKPFESCLRRCIEEIFNPAVPFKQTDNPDICKYCKFSAICGKG